MKERSLCRHCCKRFANRPRQMCWSCYYRPGVRDLYPSTSKFARRGVGDFNGRTVLAARPTPAAPGSPEKVAVLEERARLGLSLWHPHDQSADAESKEFRSSGCKVRLDESVGCYVSLPKEKAPRIGDSFGGSRGEERMPRQRR